MLIAHRHRLERSAAQASRPGEHGAIMVLLSICITVLITAVALTVDLGRVSTTRRDLQKVADVAALDLARLLDGRTTAQIVADPQWGATLAASTDQNGFPLTGGRTATVSIGHWDRETQVFTPTTGAEVPDAVRVVTATDIDHAFAPGGAHVTRTGVAAQQAAAGFSIGSFAARLDSESSPLLGALVGDALGVTLVGHEGLAGVNVGLEALATELGLTVGSPNELLSTELRLVDVIRAEAEVLRAGGNLVQANLLDSIALGLPDPDLPVVLGDLLSIATGGEAVAALAELDALELLSAVAFVANGSSFLDLPDVGLTLPGGVVTTSASVQVIERPRWAFGPVGTTVQTAQVRLRAEVSSDIPLTSRVSIELDVQSAAATGTTTAINCGTPDLIDLNVQTGLLNVRADITARLAVLGIPVVDVLAHAATGTSPANYPFGFTIPPDVIGESHQVPTTGLNLGGAAIHIDELSVIGLPLPGVVDAALELVTNTVLGPLLTLIDDQLVSPLASALGLSLAGADATPLGVACSGPALVG